MEFEDTVTILNRLGLHARPACRFAQKASEFDADVWLVKGLNPCLSSWERPDSQGSWSGCKAGCGRS
ncbi:MAG: HPr family phosphocarrier protein [Deltaproteobacteria bacterium]|nr:HPr family phosphocarrier protein [Deltaproteobacteria bacterium]